MHTSALSMAAPDGAAKPAPQATLAAFQKDEQGATAVEFGLIAVPFVTMLLGIISVCLYFFTVLELENAVWQGSRDVRVGAYGAGSGAYVAPVTSPPMTEAEKTEWRKDKLKTAICNRMRDPACSTKLRVLLQSNATIAAGGLVRPDCRDGTGNLITSANAAAGMQTTGASSFVVLTGCYSWTFGGKLPFFKIGNMPDGSFLVQASFAFVNENYN